MTRKCQSKNPATCKVHGTGGQLEQLNTLADKALDEKNANEFFRLKEQMQELNDTPEQEVAKKGFFSRFLPRPTKAEVPPASAPTVSPEIARDSLKRYVSSARYDTTLADQITPLLNDESKSVKSATSDASVAAEEVYDTLWNDYSEKNGNKNITAGGIAAAKATCQMFYRMGRESELGWIEKEAPNFSYSAYLLEQARAVSWAEPEKR